MTQVLEGLATWDYLEHGTTDVQITREKWMTLYTLDKGVSAGVGDLQKGEEVVIFSIHQSSISQLKTLTKILRLKKSDDDDEDDGLMLTTSKHICKLVIGNREH